MDLLIPDNWLRNHLNTKASPKELQKYLSLSGPTVDRVNGVGKETVYEIEVTTNRPDAMSVYGVAREAAAILPRYGIRASLNPVKTKAKQKLVNKVQYLDLRIEKGLVSRSSAILLNEVTIKDSPKFIQDRLKQVGERPINNVVDISNYLMHELGQPVHIFDYDKISGRKMIMRKSEEGEEIITLDGKSYKLPAGGIVIEDGNGKLIDMPGIMGGENSAVDKNTKNILLFVQTYNSSLIRQLAMKLDKWSNAARLFEKGLDPEQIELTIRRGIDMLAEYAGAKPEKEILDLYFEKSSAKSVQLNIDFINKTMGIEVSKKEIDNILRWLGFLVKWDGDRLEVTPPSYRTKDIEIPEDVIEEIARVYGYQNIPGKLMSGALPAPIEKSPFEFEQKVKGVLKGLGGSEVYTLSLVSLENSRKDALKLSNPLGGDTEYLRTSLLPSLLQAVNENKHWEEPMHLFEMANVYAQRKDNLPDEKLTLAGIFKGYEYRKAKGVLEVLYDQLNIPKGQVTGLLSPVIGTDLLYYELSVKELHKLSKPYSTFVPIPQFPSQIEDLTLVLPNQTKVGEVIKEMLTADNRVKKVDLVDIYEDAHTFRVWFQDPSKTLSNDEVAVARNKVTSVASKKFGATLKD